MTHINDTFSQAQDQVLPRDEKDWERLTLHKVLSVLEHGTLPSVENLACILSKCKQEMNPSYVFRLHVYLCETGMEAHSSLGNELVCLLVDVGNMHDAKLVFDKLVCPSESSWNALIMGYVKYGEPEAALNLYKNWKDGAVHPSKYSFMALIKACTTLKDLNRGSNIHDHIKGTGTLESDIHIGGSLVDMYAKCRCLAKAHELFDKLSAQEVNIWNALIAGYTEQRQNEKAFELFKRMKENGVSPNAETYVPLLTACGKDIHKGQELHAEIARNRLLIQDTSICNALIRIYSQCGFLIKAEELFNSLVVREVSSCNAIMAAYSQCEHGEKVLSCLRNMKSEGVTPDAYSLCCSLKACGMIGAADEGQKLHAEIDRQGLLKGDMVLGNALVDMYAQCGLVDKAQEIFDELPQRDTISWNALMTGYVNLGLGENALVCYEGMKGEGICPDMVSFLCGLKACGCARDSGKGQEMHAEILKGGLEGGLLVGSKLVDMYAKCGLVGRAQKVFDMLKVRDVVTWNALISGYCNHELSEKALICLEKMKQEGFTPTAVTYVCSLRACGNIGALDRGEKLHDEIARNGMLDRHLAVGNALIDMYGKCGSLAKAQEVFYKLPTRDIVSWNALIGGFVQHGCGKEALLCLEQMRREGVSPDATTYACSLKACSITAACQIGEDIHAEVVAKGLLKTNLYICSSLVDMYVKFGLLAKAQEVFDELPVQDIVSWNALISGYSQYGRGEEVLSCFAKLQHEGVIPDAITYVCTLKACGNLRAADTGEKIEAQICKEGLQDLDIGNAIVEMYAKCGLLTKACKAFNKLLVRDVYTWNALIVGYVNHNVGEEALQCVEKMKYEGIILDEITCIYTLKACSLMGAIDKGEELLTSIVREGSFESTLNLGVAMLDMYAKCGLLTKAQEVFCKFPVNEVVAWNALITGYALVGKSRNVSLIFDKMMRDGQQPNTVTFVGVLNSCNHAGLVVEGKAYFESMKGEFGVIPELDHYTCIVDLLSRAGQLEEAVVLANQMPFHSNLVVWHIVLSACRHGGSVEIGTYAFEQSLMLDKEDFSALTCMSNILEDSRDIEALRVNHQAWDMLEHSIYLYANDKG